MKITVERNDIVDMLDCATWLANQDWPRNPKDGTTINAVVDTLEKILNDNPIPETEK